MVSGISHHLFIHSGGLLTDVQTFAQFAAAIQYPFLSQIKFERTGDGVHQGKEWAGCPR